MYGMIFLALIGGGLGYLLFTSQGQAIVSTISGTLAGWGIEPVFNISYFTDWITWCLTDTLGLALIASMGFVALVLIMNIASGDASR